MKTKTDKEEEVTMMDVYKEFNEKIAESHKILQFKSRKVDATTHLIFQEYLEVVYPANQPMVPSDLQVEVFSHVFGTNTSALEHLLWGLAGWTCLLVQSRAFTRPSHMAWPFDFNAASSRYLSTKLERMDTEQPLPGFFLAKLDPDLIMGHDFMAMGWHRMNVNKIPQWSKLGRLRRANIQTKKGRTFNLEKNVMCGRLVCDVKISAKELIRSRSYDLGALCENVLHVKEEEQAEVTIDEVKRLYGASQSLLQLISCTMQDAAYIIRLMCELNMMPLALQITNIAGNVMSQTLMGGRSERNEFLLLHAFTEKNFIVSDK
ncbi:DNA polymerase alpha catalytic subunit-like [Periplaneta americana]|uniref:DNA polymerase alpha catalytic subunit-like n=1 Tax=Periplaneta americana TaxID=6978 RepID=UPI0037E7FA23